MRAELPKVAVVDGAHPYDVVSFHRLFRSFEDIDCYIQSLENWLWNWGENFDKYRAVVFYHFHPEIPAGFEEAFNNAMCLLTERGIGIVILHHALLAFPREPLWSDLCGIPDRSFQYFPNQSVTVVPASGDHPIVHGLTPWPLQDETYTMAEPSPETKILFTVDHPKSMRAIGWIRRHGKSNVFCLQLGHDAMVWREPNFREVLHRGIRWTWES